VRFERGHDLTRRPHKADAKHPCEKCRREANRTFIDRLVPWVLVLLGLATPALAAESPVHLCITTGGAVVLSGESSAAMTPSAHISVRGPVVLGGTTDGKGKTPLGFGAELELTGLPGETVAASEVESIKALELAVSIERVIGKLDGADPVTTALYVESGFATRLPHDPAPRDRYPRWAALGLRLRQGDHYFAAAIGVDQRLDGLYQPAALISGQVGVNTGLKDISVLLRGSAILGLSPPGYGGAPAGGRRDVVRIGVVLGR
jgi:hypothetical protein